MLLSLVASRWVAGRSVASAMAAARQARFFGMKPIINHLGEHYKDRWKVERAVQIYREVLASSRHELLKADLSVKLSQLGLLIGKGYCLQNLLALLEAADRAHAGIWLDMEAPATIQDTLDLYFDAAPDHPHLAVTLQANLERTRSDLLHVLRKNGRVRLVKGAYPGDYQEFREVEARYARLLRILFAKGDHFAVATRNQELVNQAVVLQTRARKEMEFQLLRGMSRPLKRQLLRADQAVGEYIPFGDAVSPYAWRRVKEIVRRF
ncbi:MAG: proline dehydrogenase family protein [Candidatus Aenigmarchaeota archaeon]|nr:proline dehydrogenase family protein [Candidatus Aenigmarchaeota archaeon]